MQHHDNDIGEGVSTPKKKKDHETSYFCIKTSKRGSKIIRIEIYDAEIFENSQNKTCNCDANICMQYVVDSDIFYDDIYNSTKNLMTKMQKSMEKTLI